MKNNKKNKNTFDFSNTIDFSEKLMNSNKKMLIKRKSTFEISVHVIIRYLMVYMISITIFSLIIPQNTILKIFFQIIKLFILGYSIYSLLWYEGDRDKRLVLFNKIKQDKLRGLKIGLISSIPFSLMYILLIISKSIYSQKLFSIYTILSMPFREFINILVPNYVILNLANWKILILLIIPLMFILFCFTGYYMGYNQISIQQIVLSHFTKKSGKK